MNTKIEWFRNKEESRSEQNIEYVGLKNNLVICRIKRGAAFSDFWVARDIKGDYLFRDQYRHDVMEWVETAYGE
jgi:hypothetical protein